MAKKKIDPAFKAAQQLNRLIDWGYPSKVKKAPTRIGSREIARTDLERRNAEAAAEQEKRVKERRAQAEKKKTLKEYYKEILSEMGKIATTPREKKLAAHYGDPKTITRGDVITAAKKKQGLDEMALTKAAMKQELKKLKRLEDQDSRVLSRHTGRQVGKATDALSQLLRSKDLYDVDSKGGLTKVGELKGRRAAGELTGAAMFGMRGNRLDPATIPSAKELVNKHGMIYVGQDWDDEQLHPLAQTAAIGGKRGPTTAFLRPAKITKRYRD